jgi:hypothetical protein
MTRYRPADLSKLRRAEARKRASLVDADRFAKPLTRRSNMRDYLNRLPDFLKASDWKSLLDAIAKARKNNKPIFWFLGAHVLKCGLSPLMIDLLRAGLVDLVAFNGAGAIHDLEIAFLGQTSEDVAAGLGSGRFGMAKDTATWFAAGADVAASEEIGLGEGFGRFLSKAKAPYKRHSLMAQCHKADVPLLVFPAIGAEIVAQHPEFDGAKVGAAAHIDFRVLAGACRRLHNGGVVLHFGSAVVLPEVFLKALSVARNQRRVEKFTTANFDMIQHYRPNVNVVSRPTLTSGRGFSFTGHHELMLPLLAWSIKSVLRI